MALWKEVLTLNSEDLQKIGLNYNDETCPIEVRYYCANWIEEEINRGTDPQTFYNGLIHQLRSRAASLQTSEPFWVKMKLYKIVEFFESTYKNNPRTLLQMVTLAVQKELELVKKSEQAVNRNATAVQHQAISSTKNTNYRTPNVPDTIQAAKKASSDTGAALKKIEDELQLVNLNYQEYNRVRSEITRQQQMNITVNELDSMELQRLHYDVNKSRNTITSLKEYFEQLITTLIADLAVIMAKVLDDELKRWVNAQYLYGNDNIYTDIDLIQRWCEELVDLIWTTREQLKYAVQLQFPGMPQSTNGVKSNFAKPLSTCTRLLIELLKKTFIVHSIPSQVLKTSTRFPPPYNVTIRYLLGGKLNVHTTSPPVQIELINEKNAKNVMAKGTVGKPNGVLMNNKGRMEYNRESGEFSAVFKNLRTISREKSCSTAAGAASDIVTREKFFLIATTEVTVGDLNLKLYALSPPQVVISHGSQEAQAWATITWTNIFGSNDTLLHDAPDAVSWSQVAELLDRFALRTLGKGLTQNNLQFLATKAPIKDGLVTLTDFTKTQPGYDFSFWEWYFKAIRLLEKEKHLKELWVGGHVIGFIKKEQGEALLAECTPGNFLIRISETVPGAVTISWIEKNRQVYSMEPFTTNSLKIQSLAEKVRDLENFEYLYPDTPKDIVFKKYYEATPSSSVVKPYQYVKPFHALILRGSQFQGSNNSGSLRSSFSGSCNESSPNTPHSQSLSVSPGTDSFLSSRNSPVATLNDAPMDTGTPTWMDDWLNILESQNTNPIPYSYTDNGLMEDSTAFENTSL